MNNFVFNNPVRVYFGEGMMQYAMDMELPRIGKRVLLAYGGGSIKRNGVYDKVVGMLKAAGKEIVEFPGITPNPRYTEVQALAKLARENKVDFMLAVGGGSVIDCVRTAAVQALLDEDIWTVEVERHELPKEAIPMGIVLTLGGTGSDMNWLAGINDEERHEKVTYAGKHAEFDIIDPSFTKSVPMGQLLTGVFDTLSHFMETYFGKGDCVSDEVMESIMANVVRNARIIKERLYRRCADAVDDRAAADSQHEINFIFAGKLCAGLNFRIAGIRRDPGKLDNFLTCRIQHADDFVIDAVSFDGPAAISKKYTLSDFGKLHIHGILHHSFPEIYTYGIVEYEIVHHSPPFPEQGFFQGKLYGKPWLF